MRNQKSKKNRGGALDCQYPDGSKTRSYNDGNCPSGSNKVSNSNNIEQNTNPVKVKSPVITCKRDKEKPKSFLVSELQKRIIQINNKEEERPLCPKGYYFDSVSKTEVAYQDLIEEGEAKQIMDNYEKATYIKPLEEEERPSSGGKRKRTFRRRKQRKQRKTSKK